MKKFFLVLAALLLCVSCSKKFPSPTSVVEDQMKTFKNEALSDVTGSMGGEGSSESEKALKDQMGKMLSNISYKLDNESVDGDEATVDGHFKTYDFETSFYNTMSEFLTQGITMAMNGASDEEINDLLYKIWYEDLVELEKEGMSKEFDYTFELEKTKESWEITNGETDEFIDGILGGLMSGIASLSQSLE